MHYIFIPHAKPNATESQRITPTPAMALAVLWRWQLQAMATTMETRSKHNTRLESERRLTAAAHTRFLLEFERALGGLLPFIPSPAAATLAATQRCAQQQMASLPGCHLWQWGSCCRNLFQLA